jgi:serine protease
MSMSTGGATRRRLGRAAVILVAAACALATATGVASASTTSTSVGKSSFTRAGMLGFFQPDAGIQPAAPNDLIYHGGFIQDHVQVFLVFWGSQWRSDTNGVEAYTKAFFAGLGTSGDAWSRVTSQYTGRGLHPVFSGSVLKGTWDDTAAPAPGRASAGAIAAEARKAARHFNTSGHNASIIVMSPHGTHPDGFPSGGFCAWHDATGGLPFTNMPYVLDAGRSCGQNAVGGRLDGFSIVAGHEYLEAVTDPVPPSGWLDRAGEENADKCAWKNLHRITLNGRAFAVQPTWSNAIHGCAG